MCALVLMIATWSWGCGKGAGEAAPSTALEAAPKQLIESVDAMSAILESREQNPDDALNQLRAYIEANKSGLKSAVEAIGKTSEGMPDEETRQAYIDRHHPSARRAFERFVQAQQGFKDRANEAQKIELSYILRLLR